MKGLHTGRKVGILEIGEIYKVEDGKTYYKAKCFCGNNTILSDSQILKNKNSCGCLGTVKHSTPITDELLVTITRKQSLILLQLNGMSEVEAIEYYDNFRKQYLKDKTWI